jgi:hypothetical protein
MISVVLGARACVPWLFTLALAAGGAPLAAEPTAPWPAQVTAEYSLSFTGFGQLGTLKFQSQVQGNEYSISATADVKVPLIYTWSGRLNGSGKVAGDAPKPIAYTFSSQGKPVIGGVKNIAVRMGFKDGDVTHTSVVPPGGTSGVVPVTPDHLKQVFDPLSAVILTTRATGGSPCGRRVPIFDGKQRFDLITTSAGQQKVPEARPSGQPGIGYLCKVRYIPIAGHKDSEESRATVSSTTIEVAMRPVPSANLMVPYRVTVVTKYGTATMLLRRMDITAPGQKQIALVH